MKKVFFPALISFALFLLPFSALGIYLAELPLEEKIELSNVIFIGVVEKKFDGVATVSVKTVLKGPRLKNIKFAYSSRIMELSVRIQEGMTYLFFLRERNPGNIFNSVNGPHGVIPIGIVNEAKTKNGIIAD